MADEKELNLDELGDISGGGAITDALANLGIDFNTINSQIESYFANGGWASAKNYAVNNLRIPSSVFILVEAIPNLTDREKINSVLATIKKYMR